MFECVPLLSSHSDKFEVTPQSVPYLAALVSVSEEVRSRCHLKHRLAQTISESTSSDSISNDLAAQHSPHGPHGGATSPQVGYYVRRQLSTSHFDSLFFRGEITPLSSSYNISGLFPVCWLLFQCF